MKKFRKESSIMVSTDLGGRGLDIDDLNTIINFEFPN